MSSAPFTPGSSQDSSPPQGLRSLGRVPVIGFVLRWFADVIRLPILHRHLSYHIDLLQHQNRLLNLEVKSLAKSLALVQNELDSDVTLKDQSGPRLTVAETRQVRPASVLEKLTYEVADCRSELAAASKKTSDQLERSTGPLSTLHQRLVQVEESLRSVYDALGTFSSSDGKLRPNPLNTHLSAIGSRLDTLDTAGQRFRHELLNVSSELKEIATLSAAWDKASNIVLSTASTLEDRFGSDFSQLTDRLLKVFDEDSRKLETVDVSQASDVSQPFAHVGEQVQDEVETSAAETVPSAAVVSSSTDRSRMSCYVGDNRVLTTILRDLLLLCSSNDLQIMPAILTTGVWEPSTTTLLERLVPAGGSYLEIGANIGYFSALAATHVGHYGSVYAFEPNPESFRLLQQNLRLNRLTYLATLREMAVADTPGKRAMNSFSSNLPSSTLSKLSPTMLAEMGEASTHIEVDCTTLDQEFSQSERKFDFVKMDAEGSEPLIMLGAKTFMERNLRPDAIILLEWNPPAMRGLGADGAGMLATFFQDGFSIFRILSDHQVSVIRTIFDLDQWNLADLLITRAVSLLQARGISIV